MNSTLALRPISSNYNNQVLFWSSELAKLRNEEYDSVSWTDVKGNLVFDYIPRHVVLKMIDDRVGYKITTRRGSYFISIPYGVVARYLRNEVGPQANYRIPNEILNIPSNKTPGVEYQVIPRDNGFVIQRNGLSVSSTLKRKFKTETQALNYIKNSLKEGEIRVR